MRGGQTTEQEGGGWRWWQCDLESDTGLLAALRAALREMSIRFLGYFAERRYLASCSSNWAFQIFSQSFAPSSALSPLSPASRPSSHLLTRTSALVVFLTLRFGVSTSFTSSPLSPSPQHRPGSLQTLLHSREIAFKLFGFLTWRGFIVRNPCSIARDASRLKRSRSVSSWLECCLISFDIIFNIEV